jgi:hypothetical protein
VKLGVTPAQLSHLDVQDIAKHVSLEAAMAAKEAFANRDVKIIAGGGSAGFTWERGELYADPEHLTTTVEELGLIVQERVKIARDYYAKGGVMDTAFETMESTRTAVKESVDETIAYYRGQDGILSEVKAIEWQIIDVAADIALSPATAVSENVTPQATGEASLEVLAALSALGARAYGKARKLLAARREAKQAAKLVDDAQDAASEAATDVFEVPKSLRTPRKPDTVTRTIEQDAVTKTALEAPTIPDMVPVRRTPRPDERLVNYPKPKDLSKTEEIVRPGRKPPASPSPKASNAPTAPAERAKSTRTIGEPEVDAATTRADGPRAKRTDGVGVHHENSELWPADERNPFLGTDALDRPRRIETPEWSGGFAIPRPPRKA